MMAACTHTSRAGRDFVVDEELGLGDERAGDGNALAFAARQLMRVAVEARRRQLDPLEGLPHLGPSLGSPEREEVTERLLDDLRDRLPGVERAVRALEHVLDLPTHVRVARSRPCKQRSASERHLAREVRVQSCDAAGECRLARARLAHEGETLARSHDEPDVVQHLPRSVRRVQPAHGNERVLDLDLRPRHRRDTSCRGVAENVGVPNAENLVIV